MNGGLENPPPSLPSFAPQTKSWGDGIEEIEMKG